MLKLMNVLLREKDDFWILHLAISPIKYAEVDTKAFYRITVIDVVASLKLEIASSKR